VGYDASKDADDEPLTCPPIRLAARSQLQPINEVLIQQNMKHKKKKKKWRKNRQKQKEKKQNLPEKKKGRRTKVRQKQGG